MRAFSNLSQLTRLVGHRELSFAEIARAIVIGSLAEAETDPPRYTPKNASSFCIMCQKLFTEAEEGLGLEFHHYTTWTALIESAASGCILCSQAMSDLLQDRQEELLPRLKEDAKLNDAKITCRINRPFSTGFFSLMVFGRARAGLQLSSENLMGSFIVRETSGQYLIQYDLKSRVCKKS